MSPFETFIQQLINGLSIGMIYALIALGYTMVYGIIQLINFAHGEIFILGLGNLNISGFSPEEKSIPAGTNRRRKGNIFAIEFP